MHYIVLFYGIIKMLATCQTLQVFKTLIIKNLYGIILAII
jgi:hypothetical protein